MLFLTPAELAQLAEATDPRFRARVRTAGYSGLMAGGISWPKVERVQFLHRRPVVAQAHSETQRLSPGTWPTARGPSARCGPQPTKPLPGGEDDRPVFGDRDGVLAVCRPAPGGRAQGPPVTVGHVVVSPVGDEHGFDGYHQPGPESGARGRAGLRCR